MAVYSVFLVYRSRDASLKDYLNDNFRKGGSFVFGFSLDISLDRQQPSVLALSWPSLKIFVVDEYSYGYKSYKRRKNL